MYLEMLLTRISTLLKQGEEKIVIIAFVFNNFKYVCGRGKQKEKNVLIYLFLSDWVPLSCHHMLCVFGVFSFFF
jgi:hypothetical protein